MRLHHSRTLLRTIRRKPRQSHRAHKTPNERRISARDRDNRSLAGRIDRINAKNRARRCCVHRAADAVNRANIKPRARICHPEIR